MRALPCFSFLFMAGGLLSGTSPVLAGSSSPSLTNQIQLGTQQPNSSVPLTNNGGSSTDNGHGKGASITVDKDHELSQGENRGRKAVPTYAPLLPAGALEIAPVCPATSLNVCGLAMSVPAASLGYTATYTVPSPYVHEPLTAQCLNMNGLFTWQVIDASAITCTLLKCAPSSLTVCGVQVPVTESVSAGSTTEVAIPSSSLANPGPTPQTFTAVCLDNGAAAPTYQVQNPGSVSCNIFPCADQNVRICDTTVAIKGGTPMGGVLDLAMPPPFVPDSFTIQCVGSLGTTPMYQLTDVSEVTCQRSRTVEFNKP